MRRGAEQRKQTLTEFILQSACTEAEIALTDQRLFVLPPDRWRAFMRALDRPARANARLGRLFAEPTVLEK